MFKKLVYALALTGLASGQAFALSNPGFESGNTSGWFPTAPASGLSVVAYGSAAATVNVIDDIYGPAPYTYFSPVVDAVATADLPGSMGVGSYAGLIETCAASIAAVDCTSTTAMTFNLGGPVSAYGDYFLARLFTADWDTNYNDSVTIRYFGAASGTALATDVISVQSMDASGISYDSGWQAFGVPVGTQSIFVQVDNVAIVPYLGNPQDNLYNRPIVAIDYAAAVTPVPEADASAMMLAGLGVLGLIARRRAKRTV
jgi:hypothetical protein